MKILHMIAQLPAATGSGIYFANIINYMKKHGYEQQALFAVQDGFDFERVLGLPAGALHPVEFKTPALPFPIAGMSDVMPYESTVYGTMTPEMIAAWRRAFTTALNDLKAQFQPDVVISHHLWFLSSLAAEIFDSSQKACICHNTDLRQAELHPYLQKTYAANLKYFDKIYGLDDSQKEKINALYGIAQSKITTLGGGYNEHYFYPPREKSVPSPVRLVFAAKIDASKGIYELIRAFRQLSKDRPNLHLDIIGHAEGEQAVRLHEEIENAPNISVLPVCPQEVLGERLRQAHIFVMPSFYEGLGLVAVEALACGLYVVAGAIEGLISLLGEEVNQSGVIEYVPLPRLYNTDRPVTEDIEPFVQGLKEKLAIQIDKVERGQEFPPEIIEKIQAHSWDGLIDRMIFW